MVEVDQQSSAGAAVPPSVLADCIQAATAAPSVHNTQPWLFALRDDGIDILVDRRRQLTTLDPHGREMFVSVGAAVFNLRVALGARGWRVAVRLTPDDAQPDLAAEIDVVGSTAVTAAALALADAIGRRHTNRRPFTGAPVPDRILDELTSAAAAESASLVLADGGLRDGVLSLTRTAENRLRGDEHYRAELAAWTTPGGPGRRDGVPREALGPRDLNVALPMRDLALGQGAPTSIVEFEADPTIAMLFTRGDTPSDWLQAGAALQRLWLTATVRGLAVTPLSQVTEVAELRTLLDDSADGWVVQTLLRFGYPANPATATPRRPLDDVVVGDDD